MKKRKYSKNEEYSVIDSKHTKKSNKKTIILTLIGFGIISIMVGSALNLWQGNSKNVKYGDYKFVQSEEFNGGWNSYIDGKYYSFDYLPNEIENLTNSNINLNFKEGYILYDPEDPQISGIIFEFKSFFNEFGKTMFPACVKEEGCGDLPIYNCNEVDAIYLINSEENKIYQKDKCIVIDGNIEFYLKSINYLKYKMLGVF